MGSDILFLLSNPQGSSESVCKFSSKIVLKYQLCAVSADQCTITHNVFYSTFQFVQEHDKIYRIIYAQSDRRLRCNRAEALGLGPWPNED